MGNLWINGIYLVEDGGSLVECATCPCGGGSTVTCSYCEDNTGPAEWDVTIPSLTNDECSDCADFGGTYRLQHAGGLYPCQWSYTLSSPICASVLPESVHLQVAYNNPLSSKYSINVWVYGIYDAATWYIHWVKDYGSSKPDCDTLSSVSIPYYGVTDDPPCSTSSACTISAVT